MARASFQSADAAYIRNNVGIVQIDGVFERSDANAAAQGVIKILRCARGAAAPVSHGDMGSAIDEQT